MTKPRPSNTYLPTSPNHHQPSKHRKVKVPFFVSATGFFRFRGVKLHGKKTQKRCNLWNPKDRMDRPLRVVSTSLPAADGGSQVSPRGFVVGRFGSDFSRARLVPPGSHVITGATW